MAMMILISTAANASEREFNTGFSILSTADPMCGQMLYSLWYPTEVLDGVVRVGPFGFPGTWDAEPAAGPFGMVILSHGSGGSDLSHADTAVAWAKARFAPPRRPSEQERALRPRRHTGSHGLRPLGLDRS